MMMTVDPRYESIRARALSADGTFWYGVRTTGVYCRPACKSRLPRPQNVAFFESRESAARAGFRACRRCRPDEEAAPVAGREQALAACRLIESSAATPTLAELGTAVGMSPTHLQRVFKRVVGISPREYADALRKARLRTNLKELDGVADATYESGYGSSSRVYETSGVALGMTPAAYRRSGFGEDVAYSIVRSTLGAVIVAATERGICAVRIGEDEAALEREVRAEFSSARLTRDDRVLADRLDAIVSYLEGTGPWPHLPLDIRATAFQERVWQALLRLGPGRTSTYSEIATQLCVPAAARAVASACAANPVAALVPCHRVVAKSGRLTGYRWGLERKRKLLDLEKKPV